MIKDFINKSKNYLLILILLGLVFGILSRVFARGILEIDGSVMYFVSIFLVNDKITWFFKMITYAGSVGFLICALACLFIFIKEKKFFLSTGLSLLFTYIVSVIFKNIFRRERPLINLIAKPKDFSFPSGHTMCSVLFYGFLIYLILNYVKNKIVKYTLVTLLILLIVLVAFSRIYLNVHYFTDVVCGAVLGLVCLRMCVNYVKINNIV